MSHEFYEEKTASATDKVAWILCQIIDEDAPMRWSRYRGVAMCMVTGTEFNEAYDQLKEEVNGTDKNRG